MIHTSFEALKDSGSHLACAPTGIGKTAAALSAALDAAFNSTDNRTIFFLTGRQSQHRIVVETVKSINSKRSENQSKVKLVDMVGQQSMCINEIRKEFSSLFSRLCADMRKNRHCKPYIQNSDGIRLQVLNQPLHVTELVQASKDYSEEGRGKPVCPWKVARDAASGADVVVCDYNHLFNDRVRQASLGAMGISLSEIIIIVDEAHNLPNRITQGMRRVLEADLVRNSRFELEEYSENLEAAASKGEIEIADEVFVEHRAVKAALVRIHADLSSYYRTKTQSLNRGGSDEIKVENSEVLDLIDSALASDISGQPLTIHQVIATLSDVDIELDEDSEDEKETSSERFAEFLSILSEIGNNKALAFVFSNGKGDTPRLTSHLLDPGIVSGPVFDDAAGALLMSGTLSPPEMYGELLALPTQRPVTSCEYPSPFLSDKRPVMIASGVTTKYTQRGRDNTERIRDHIKSLLAETPGHVAVFTPSYALLQEIIGEEIWYGRRVLLEESGWSKGKIDSLLRNLEMARSGGEKILLGGVFSAKLSEGVDYHNNLLDAVVCIGLPLAPPSAELNARKEYYEDRFGSANSYRWAVQQPAINAIMQAMGRPIRKMGDRALILMLEERLLFPQFKRLLPSNMNTLTVSSPETTRRHAKRFFTRHPDPAIEF